MNAATGLLALALLSAQGNSSESQPTTQATWALPLSEAIRVGLGHSERVRITCERIEEDDQTYVTIAPHDPAASPWRFRAETMALVRTIEQHYWELTRQRAELEARAQALKSGRAIFKRALAEPRGRGSAADLADAETRLGEFEAELTEQRSGVADAERRLRQVIGIGTSDCRTIVPVTPVAKTDAKTDGKTCLGTLATHRPEPVERSAFHRAEASLERLSSQTTHTLAQSYAEVAANYQQLSATVRLRRDAASRVEVQKTSYEEGRIPLDRYLKAVSERASAETLEAQAQYSYNVSLMALEEAKGTLLDYRQVTIENAAE